MLLLGNVYKFCKSLFSYFYCAIFAGWYSGNLTTAMQIMRYNLSVAYAFRGELEKANNIVKEVCFFLYFCLTYRAGQDTGM